MCAFTTKTTHSNFSTHVRGPLLCIPRRLPRGLPLVEGDPEDGDYLLLDILAVISSCRYSNGKGEEYHRQTSPHPVGSARMRHLPRQKRSGGGETPDKHPRVAVFSHSTFSLSSSASVSGSFSAGLAPTIDANFQNLRHHCLGKERGEEEGALLCREKMYGGVKWQGGGVRKEQGAKEAT